LRLTLRVSLLLIALVSGLLLCLQLCLPLCLLLCLLILSVRILLTLVGGAACYLPASRAARTDPARVLRND